MTVVDPLVAVLAGVTLLGEGTQVSGLVGALLVAAAAAAAATVAAGVLILTRRATCTRPSPPPPAGSWAGVPASTCRTSTGE